MAGVRVEGVGKRFAGLVALEDVSIDFPDGGFYGLLGPSGSGKTTLLRIIAGFVFPDEGRVMIGGAPVETVPVERREIGMVFQNYALFPNMSVAENIAFGLRVRGIAGAERARRVAGVLDLVQLGPLSARRPQELSGGQRQRVALARAVVTEPRVLLLDEPLSALDRALRRDMQVELKRIQREVGITTIFVTHDQEEALSLSDRIGILRGGRLVEEGDPATLYAAPKTRFAAGFLGDANFFEGTPGPSGLTLADGTRIALPRPAPVCAVRPESIRIGPAPVPGQNGVRARPVQTVFSGATALHVLERGGETLRVMTKAGEPGPPEGAAEVWLTWPAALSIPLDG